MQKHLIRPFAVLSILVLAACGGGGATGGSLTPAQGGASTLATIVGVGDSLTAGYQAGGLLGVPTSNPISALPGNLVPPTQENGWWALFYEQAKGVSPATMANPATSALPLVNAPGLGNELVVTQPPNPFAPTHPGGSCDTFNQAAFQLSTALGAVRANAAATVYDLAVPGQTAHEALYAVAPQTGPASNPPSCTYASSPSDPTAGALQALVEGESSMFYPILGGFVGKVQTPDQVDDAASLHPTLATVWLGANDLLKFAFSGGVAAGSDSPAQMQADIALAIQKLQQAGARVLVANLPDVLHSAQFFEGGIPASPALCQLQNFFYCGLYNGLQKQGLPAAQAQAVATGVTQYLQAKYGIDASAYLTESGFFDAFAQVGAALAAGRQPAPVLSSGEYLGDALAAQVQALNNAYNQAIGAAAQSGGAGLVDIHAAFAQIYNGQFPGQALTATCCSLVFGGGLLSWDGLHPSNTGYAFIANIFIAQADSSFGLSIPLLTQQQLLQINAYDPYP